MSALSASATGRRLSAPTVWMRSNCASLALGYSRSCRMMRWAAPLTAAGRREPNGSPTSGIRPIDILLVEDNPGDVGLTIEALREGKISNHLNIARDGLEALASLRRQGRFTSAPRPDLILLDLDLPIPTSAPSRSSS